MDPEIKTLLEVEGLTPEPSSVITAYFSTSLQHLLAELERIDLLVQMHVLRAKQTHPAVDPLQGLYISEEEIDSLVASPKGIPRWFSEKTPWSLHEVQTASASMSTEIHSLKTGSLENGVLLRLDQGFRHGQKNVLFVSSCDLNPDRP